MEKPKITDESLRELIKSTKHPKIEPKVASALTVEDDAYFQTCIDLIRKGKKAIVIVQDEDERLKYMFSYAERPEAIMMLGKVIEAVGRRMAE